jgi:hypothetical protein
VNCLIGKNEVFGGGGGYGGASIGGDGGDAYGGGLYNAPGSVPEVENCTISMNLTAGGSGGWGLPGPYGEDGSAYGAGIFVDNASVSNCIIWGNYGVEDIYGLAVVTFSDVGGGWPGEDNIDADPCFVSGPDGDYYLSQVSAGQAVDSPCVDAGSDLAANLGMDTLITRADEVGDSGIVDMGYHHPISGPEPIPGDMDEDFDVDGDDYTLFAAGWGVPSMTIRRGSVVVDGNLGDWPAGLEWVPLDKVYYGSPNDLGPAWFALQWDVDANKVYVAVIAYDSNHVFSDEYVDWDASDRIEIYSQGDAEGGSGWTGVYDVAQHYMAGPNTADGSWATWGQGEPLDANVGLECAVVVDGDQIIYEVGVTQFDNYGGFSAGETIITDLDVGDVVRFDVVASSRFSDGFGMISENQMTGKYNNADRIARYMLVGESGGPPCLEQRVFDLDGNCVTSFADLWILVEQWLAGK